MLGERPVSWALGLVSRHLLVLSLPKMPIRHSWNAQLLKTCVKLDDQAAVIAYSAEILWASLPVTIS